jgi:hypothetical protein
LQSCTTFELDPSFQRKGWSEADFSTTNMSGEKSFADDLNWNGVL